MIVLNPFLDSLGNFGFKNIHLIPGIPNRCFQHPQDVVRKDTFLRCSKKMANKNKNVLGSQMIIHQDAEAERVHLHNFRRPFEYCEGAPDCQKCW